MSFTKDESELFQHLKKLPAQTIFSDSPELMSLCYVHSNKMPFVPNAFMSTSSNKTILNNLLIGYKCIGFTKQQVIERFTTNQGYTPPNKQIGIAYDYSLNKEYTNNDRLLSHISHSTYLDKKDNAYNPKEVVHYIDEHYDIIIGQEIPNFIVINKNYTVTAVNNLSLELQQIYSNNTFIVYKTMASKVHNTTLMLD